MKHLFCLLLTGIVLISLTACRTNTDDSDKNAPSTDHMTTSCSKDSVDESMDIIGEVELGHMTTACSKDSVDEFMDIIGEVELGGLSTGMKLDKEHCYNVTPLSVAEQTDIKIFKFSDSCVSLALIDGEVHSICESFGGYGFVNAVPWDYDEDGNLDLLVASSWGSGLHRSIISVFNTTTKESIVVYDTSTTDNPSVDLFVAVASPSFSSKDPQDLPVYYEVYSANIEINGNNLADLSYTATGVIGSVVVENGTPVFKPMGD